MADLWDFVGDILTCVAVQKYVKAHPDETDVALLIKPYIGCIALASLISLLTVVWKIQVLVSAS